jgi:NAD(P)H-hydrate epimerase
MKVATAQEMRTIDRIAMEDYCYPGLILMEHAALGLQRVLSSRFELGKVAIVCGKGNNAGDGWALARLLYLSGYLVTVFRPDGEVNLPPDARQNREMALKLGINELPWSSLSSDPALLSVTVVVDALLGTGFRGKVAGDLATTIELINNCTAPVIAVDIPSGVEADTGRISGPAIKADLTLTFGLPKVGLMVYPGREYAGGIIVDPIGLPKPLLEGTPGSFYTLDDDEIRELLPVRKPDSHKGNNGHLLVIGGWPGMTGAPVLAGLAGLRSGAGLVTLGLREGVILSEKPMEVMVKRWPELKFEDYQAIIVGPGLSTNEDGRAILKSILSLQAVPRVLDADALNILATMDNWWEEAKGSLILTPHPGEMARLAGISTSQVQEERLSLVREKAKLWGVTLVLKGAATLVSSKGGPVYINPTGNPGLATAGTGDVLAGMIGGLLAQGLNPVQAATVGVNIHGRTGDLAAKEIGPVGILAGDLLPRIPYVLK